jgi:salicylate hydroxylase
MSDERPILIAGGGIGGLALALALARLGRASIVLERQAALSAAGAGIQLGPNAVGALRGLGLAEALRPWVGEPEAIEVHAAASGRLLARLPLGRWIADRHGAPYWAMHRGDLHRVLAEVAASEPLIEVRSGFEVASAMQSADEVNVEDDAGHAVSGPMLVGADGLWSAVRRGLAQGAPQPVGATATRTVIPAARGGVLSTASVGLWLGADAHVVHYPVRAGTEIAVTVIAREDWQGRTWDAEADAGALSARLAPFHGSLRQALVPPDGAQHAWRKWALHTLPALPAWARGRIVLIGDAAHPVLPFLAQGGALAIEDAVTLARCLCAAADLGTALARFGAERAPRAHRVQAASRRQGRIYRLAAPFSWARDAVLALAPGHRLMAGFDWLYGWRPPA